MFKGLGPLPAPSEEQIQQGLLALATAQRRAISGKNQPIGSLFLFRSEAVICDSLVRGLQSLCDAYGTLAAAPSL